ncbi:MAG: murein L,D-transpeptidase catalytic domain family protein [Syntrophobacteraceae bacterium]
MGKHKYWLLTLIIVSVVLFPWPAGSLLRKQRIIYSPLPVPPPSVQKGSFLDKEAYRAAFQYYRKNLSQFRNRRYITVIDYTKPSTSRRFFLVEVRTGKVQSFTVTHGKKSGWVYAKRFSNNHESFQSPRGFFRTGDKYCGKYGPSLEMHGLEKGVNDNAYSRRIVIHGADYANPRSIIINWGRLGRSLGCPALPREIAEQVIDKIKNGSLLYVHTREQGSSQRYVRQE